MPLQHAIPVSLVLLASVSQLSYAQLLPGLAADVSNLSTFFQLLNSTKSLYDRIRQGNVTVLAPTNDAFNNFQSLNTSDAGEVEALLSYHTLQGRVPGASLAGSPSFLQTLLINSAYTNVTEGQIVEAKGVNKRAMLISGLWATSRLLTSDIFFQHGLIHTIDTVLTIPEQVAQSVTAANLSDYVALGESMGMTDPTSLPFLEGIQRWPNTTIFAPNSPEFSSNFTDWNHLTQTEYLRVFRYHLINGSVLYSENFTDGAIFQTALGSNVTIRVVNGSTYVNDAKISCPDLLTATGVIQVLDRPLNPNNTNTRPELVATSTSTPSSANGSSRLSVDAKAGLAVALVIAVLGIAALLVGLAIRSRRRTMKARRLALEKKHNGFGARYKAGELPPDAGVSELPNRASIRELPGQGYPYELQ